MSLITNELQDVKSHCEDQIEGSKVITCVPSMVRVEIKRTKFKQLTACIQFPDNYPEQPLIIEFKSKTLAARLLDGLCKVCEKECKKYLGKPQILRLLKFVSSFIDENPLCVCSEEIASIKKELISENDDLKLKQKTSSLYLQITQEAYRIVVKITVPHHYPEEQIRVELKESNFPDLFTKFFCGQSLEISRQCIQPPLKRKPKDPPFEPKPALWPIIRFLIKEVKRFPHEKCPVCKERCLPSDPKEVTEDPNNPKFVERVYCGHIYHYDCLLSYLKTPPFQGGKKCPNCGNRIYHDRWKLTPNMAEARWAHQEARHRELEEVEDFLHMTLKLPCGCFLSYL
ncbi:uncharacterized protein LOC106464969 isoform X2 [Limulus polyphemus]|uniref:Uncharacterized protein LOC106464969 isoform X2 n=1 Tax=Limulus polyphemus TaxID=6850 RepID=A0ABM1BEW7_LIMPO|nr:uncharacterized protein LOC106464969 isoform X2 [Limulus polyphemus]